MKVACITTFDIHNPAGWPRRHLGLYGASAKIAQTLEAENVTIDYLGALNCKRSPITRLKWQFYRSLRHEDFYSWADPIISKSYARQIEQKLSSSKADILLCPENAIPLATVKTTRPIVLWTDTTLGSLIDFYPYLSNLCAETRHRILMMEQSVLERCSLVIFNSQWAAQKAHDLYKIPLSKTEVIPRGASQTQQLSPEAIKAAIGQRTHRPCRLLFVGVEWYRKGGDMALSVAQMLNAQGLETELHIVGCVPPVKVPDFVKVHGFIDRTTPTGEIKLSQLFLSAHFLIFPTRADALGVALSEAAAFGVPALAANVGGIGSLVKADITGQTFAAGSTPADYCASIMTYMADSSRYQTLAHSAFEYYKNQVSWPAAGKRARAALEKLVSNG